MKRFLIATVLIAVIVGIMLYFVPKPNYADVLAYVEHEATVNIYCRKTDCDSVDTGLGHQVTCSVDDFKATLASCRNVDGYSVTFCGSVDEVFDILNRLQATAISCQQLNDLYVVCAYSRHLRGGVTLDGKQVNVQIAYRNNTVTVGYPLILGSY